MRLRLLGRVELLTSGGVLEAGPPQRRAVLASLAVDAGRPVTMETIIDRVWGDRAPAQVRPAVHVQVAGLRRLFERAGATDERPVRLLRHGGGYVIDLEPDRVDLHRFRRLVEQARAPSCGDRARLVLLREALALWHGEPLAGLTGEWVSRCRQVWRQQQVEATVAWASVELVVGDRAAVIGQLSELVGEHPLAEPATAVLMRALHQAGRSADALDRYRAIRDRLVAELGTEPGAELQHTRQQILRGHAARSPARPAVPTQLPRDVRGFTGRRQELAQLDTILAAPAGQGTAVVISALSGTAGVGKTALAVHWAHLVRERFPDGQLYVNLRGFDASGSVLAPAEAVRGFLDALGVAPHRIPAAPDARTVLYRDRLAGRRVLVLLDNARDTAQVRPLLPDTPGCMAVVTSRNQLAGLVTTDGAHPIGIDLLAPAEARDLLAHRIDPRRVLAEPDAVAEIVTRCARLPLALTIVAARAATQPRMPLLALAAEIRDTHDRLDVLTTDDPHTSVRAVLSWSYRALTAPAARLFRLLGLHPGPDISVAAAASLGAVPPALTRAQLAELTQASLVVEHTPGRYACHDLLRVYAAERAHAEEPVEVRDAATHRMLDHYLHSAHAADRLLYPNREPILLAAPRAGTTPEHFADHQQALSWFATEHPVLLAGVDLTAGTERTTHTWQLAWTLANHLYRRGHWHDQISVQQHALTAAGRLADPAKQALAHGNLALAHLRLNHFEEARGHHQHALERHRQAGNETGQAHSHLNLALTWELQGQHVEALVHADQALDVFTAAGHRWGQAAALNTIGWCHAQLGDHPLALTHCLRALDLYRELDDRDGQAATRDSLGYIHHRLGRHAEAIAYYQRAVDEFRQLGDRHEEATTLTNLGDAHHGAGDLTAARRSWQLALDILLDLDHPDAARLQARLTDSG